MYFVEKKLCISSTNLHSQTVRARELKFERMFTSSYLSCVRCHMSDFFLGQSGEVFFLHNFNFDFGHNLSFDTIWVFEFCPNFYFWVLSQFEFLSFVIVCFLEFCHNLFFWVLSNLSFSFVTLIFFSFVIIQFFEFFHNFSFELGHNLSYWVL